MKWEVLDVVGLWRAALHIACALTEPVVPKGCQLMHVSSDTARICELAGEQRLSTVRMVLGWKKSKLTNVR
jgi:hypothetical protein